MSMMTIFRDIIVNEGPANLYRGVASPVLAEAPKRAIKFSANAVRSYREPTTIDAKFESIMDLLCTETGTETNPGQKGQDGTGRRKNLGSPDSEPRQWHHSKYRTPTELMPNSLYWVFSGN